MTTENWIDLNDLQAVACAQADRWEIQIQSDAGNDKYCPFKEWDGRHWNTGYLFRGRPRQPKMKEVKMLCYLFNDHYLIWNSEDKNITSLQMIRQPHLDMTAKVPE